MEGKLDEFRERFDAIVREKLTSDSPHREVYYDTELALQEVDAKFWKLLSQFAPHGPENMSPVFVSHNLRVVGTPTVVGNGHLKFKVSQNGSDVYDAIGFNLHNYLPDMRTCSQGCLSLAYALEENTWNGKTSLQLRVKDIRVTG
jgi:single-stranded-DNA-specific exonuclease